MDKPQYVMSDEKLEEIDNLTKKGFATTAIIRYVLHPSPDALLMKFGKVKDWSIEDMCYMVACTKALRNIARDKEGDCDAHEFACMVTGLKDALNE